MIGKVVGARHSVELDKDIIIDSLDQSSNLGELHATHF
jgi:hypothetical protein